MPQVFIKNEDKGEYTKMTIKLTSPMMEIESSGDGK